MNEVLNIGAGKVVMNGSYFSGSWKEFRVDLDPETEPDYCCSMLEMPDEWTDRFDGVLCSHTLEHIPDWHVHQALKEFQRVAKPDAKILVTVPDLKVAAKMILEKGLDHFVWTTGGLKITPLDMLFGHRQARRRGEDAMCHHTAFTKETLTRKFHEADFDDVEIWEDGWNLFGVGVKPNGKEH